MTEDHDDSTTRAEFPPALGKVALRSLAAHGFSTYEQLAAVRPKDLLEIHGVGPKAIRILSAELTERGSGFRPD